MNHLGHEDRDRHGNGRGSGHGSGSGSGGGGVGREELVGRHSRGECGHILVLGLRVSGTKYAVLSYAAERSNFEMRRSGKGREKNWGTKHSVYLKSGSIDFPVPQALDFKFTHEKYNVIIIDVMRYKRHPRRLIRNEPRHVGSIHLSVRQLMDAPDQPQWFPLLGGNGYIRIQYSPSFDSAIKIYEWAASTTAARRHSSIDSVQCEYDFLGFEVPIGFEDVYQSEFSFFKMTDVNGLMWSAAGGHAEFMKLDNAEIRSSPLFEPIFWRGTSVSWMDGNAERVVHCARVSVSHSKPLLNKHFKLNFCVAFRHTTSKARDHLSVPVPSTI